MTEARGPGHVRRRSDTLSHRSIGARINAAQNQQATGGPRMVRSEGRTART
jgi:hypothetical protein